MKPSKSPTAVDGARSRAAHGSANPTRQPCGTCRYFRSTKSAGVDGWCESIENDVKSWWTGCVRHSPNDKVQGRVVSCPSPGALGSAALHNDSTTATALRVLRRRLQRYGTHDDVLIDAVRILELALTNPLPYAPVDVDTALKAWLESIKGLPVLPVLADEGFKAGWYAAMTWRSQITPNEKQTPKPTAVIKETAK